MAYKGAIDNKPKRILMSEGATSTINNKCNNYYIKENFRSKE